MTREEEIQKAAIDDCQKYTMPYGVRPFIAGAEWADKHPAKKQAVTINAWVARNKCVDNYSNTNLVLGKERPTLHNGTWCSMEEYFPLPQDAFPNITFENSPKKVKVTIELEDE